jgi:hypothetical protein
MHIEIMKVVPILNSQQAHVCVCACVRACEIKTNVSTSKNSYGGTSEESGVSVVSHGYTQVNLIAVRDGSSNSSAVTAGMRLLGEADSSFIIIFAYYDAALPSRKMHVVI